ncbi:SDR family oxidoreductase [Vagococcus fluvialis]|uniref:SDR family oxidoreductase n=1 Tax=Vagococcus fluvialis TaxID=2738 RepID=UPI002891F8B6|nr:SDR family oxidoreductase [Vagococcus fluvialis]MDT2746681.1 SDR family NAD(P)-dependent oxidoreductase [Vagococcus fluvialis]
MSKTYMIFGGSKGLGDAFSQGLPESGDKVYILSRSLPRSIDLLDDGVERIWLQTDLSDYKGAKKLTETIQEEIIDVIIYNVGIWEERGFEDDYNFENDKPEDIANLINTNITSPIVYLQSLLTNIKQANNGKIILIGSTDGLENNQSTQVSFVASKFSMRGIAHALREHLRASNVAVTCINPGNLAAEIPFEEGREVALETYDSERIPVQDIVNLVKAVISLSKAATAKEINIPAMKDSNI